jgi:5-methylcytosine-specific restriction endonuclease McrA
VICHSTFPRRGRYRPKITCGDACDADLAKARKGIGIAVRRANGRPIETELIVDRAVCEAAGWRCAICGVRTPADHRGTIRPDAPEIDHIIPIAAGGDHTHANVQCLCRLCNIAKGDHPYPHVTFWKRRGINPPI